jgi:hypothetical protein
MNNAITAPMIIPTKQPLFMIYRFKNFLKVNISEGFSMSVL